jgi:dihydropteroate synthase
MHKEQKKEFLVCRGRTLDLTSPVIMGILNSTPDSFYDGGKYVDLTSALARISKMCEEGAAIIDIGGESTRPGSDPVSEEEELRRVIPLLEKAVPEFPGVLFSIDTTRYRVALEAIRTGVHFLNDVSGLQKEPRFADLCAEFGTALIVMHAKGEPKSMQHNPEYEDVLAEIVAFLDQKVTLLRRLGVESIVVDPGIGFGKTLEHNVTLLRQLQVFNRWETPVLIGVSRKSMIGDLLGGRDREGRLAGTIAAHYDAMVRGAKIIRVHDIQEAKDAILVYNALRA